MKKCIISLLSLLLICVFGQLAFASPQPDQLVLTKENAAAIGEAAQKGDAKAIKAIMNADCFNHEKVNEKLKGVIVDPAHPKKTIIFDDGSTLTTELKVLSSTSNSWIESLTKQWGLTDVIDMVSYTITAQWHKDPNSTRPDAVVYDTSWDSGRARYPVEITLGGTKPVYTSGDYIKVTGSVRYNWIAKNIPMQTTKKCEFKGYTGGYCEMNEI